MPVVTRILTDSACAELEKEGRYVPRSVVLPNKSNVLSYSKKPERLDLVIRREMAVLPEGSSWMRCWCITARPEDGLSWSAQGIQNTLVDLFPGFSHIGIPKAASVDRLPPIAHVIGIKKFLRLAARRKLTTPFLSLRSWTTPLILAASLGLAVLIRVLEVLWKVNAPSVAQQVGPRMLDLTFWSIAGASAVAGLLSQWTGVLFANRTIAKSTENYLSNIDEKRKTQEFSGLIDDLATELAGFRFPRTVVIDHFDQLESVTQEVIDRYFSKYSDRAIGSELWVVFESGRQKTFASLAAVQSKSHGYTHTHFALQTPLDRTQKQALADLLGLDPKAVEFESVKRMCQYGSGTDDPIALRFRDYRAHHPADPTRYGPLDLTYLLALTARPSTITISDRFLRNNLSTKEGIAADLLHQLLRGSTLRRDEISTALVDVREQFGSLLGFVDGEEPAVRIPPEAADVLEAMADELALAPPGLGHLFWAVFWHSLLLRHPIEVPWIQKLARHLLESDVSRAAQGISQAALDQTLEAALFTIRGCFEACVFDSIDPLLQHAALLLPSGSTAQSSQRQIALREFCGDAVALLGSMEAVRVLTELRATTPHLLKSAKGALEVVGFETAAQSSAGEDSGADFGQTHSQHLRLRGVWLALSVRALLPEDVLGLLQQGVFECLGELRQFRESARKREARAASSQLSATEALSLSMALWCSALSVPLVLELARIEERLAGEEPARPGQAALAWFSEFTDFAADSIQLVSATDGKPEVASGLLPRALRREVTASAAAAVVVAWRQIQESFDTDNSEAAVRWPDDLIQKAGECLRAASAIFEEELPSISGQLQLKSSELAATIDRWMHLGSMVWHAFNLDQLRDLAIIRRTQFNALCRRSRAEEYDHLLLQSEGGVIDRQDYTGLLANCVAADCLRHAGELSSHYARRAATIVRQWDVSGALRNEFCHLAVSQGHTFHVDMRDFIQELLAENPGEPNGLESYFSQVLPGGLSSAANRYLNAANRTGDGTIIDGVVRSIRSYLDKHPGHPGAVNVEALLDLDRLNKALAAKEAVSADRELLAWRPRRDSWLYPALLESLYTNSLDTDEVCEECCNILSENRPEDNSNCRLLLAISIIERCEENGSKECAAALQFVRRGISAWEYRLSAERNVEVFTILCWLDPGHRQEYAIPLARWQLIRLHREHLQDFPELVSQGQYFLLFLSYFETMEVWGLHTEIDRQELAKRRQLPIEQRKDKLQAWKQHSGRPVPFKSAAKKIVAAEFLVIGAYLFERPLAEENDYLEDRAAFNAAAQQALPALLQQIVALSGVPKPIKELLRTHSERLYNFSLPPDLAVQAQSATGS